MVTRRYVPDTGDIVWLAFDPQAGHEQGDGTTTRSRGRCSGKGFFTGGLRSKLRTLAVFSAAASATRPCW